MRKMMYFAGASAIIVAAAYGWSYSTQVSSHNTASVIAIPQLAAVAAGPVTPLSSTEIMINYKKPMSVEQWDAF